MLHQIIKKKPYYSSVGPAPAGYNYRRMPAGLISGATKKLKKLSNEFFK